MLSICQIWLQIAKYVSETVIDRFQALALTLESKLKLWTAQDSAPLQHFSFGVVREKNPIIQIKALSWESHSPMAHCFQDLLPRYMQATARTGPICLSKEEALQDNAQLRVRKFAWVEIIRNNTCRTGAVRNVSSNQEPKNSLSNIYLIWPETIREMLVILFLKDWAKLP